MEANLHLFRRRDSAAALLTSQGPGRTIFELRAKTNLIVQGDPATAVYYICRGLVQLTIVSKHGKEAVVAILSAGDFFGEGCIAGQTTYQSSAVTMSPCRIVRIDRDSMLRLIEEQPAALKAFMRFILARSCRIEADLVDQIFNSTERRLARALSLLTDPTSAAHETYATIPRISQEVLAAKVGTTRSRVNIFMNKFRKIGLVKYDNSSRTMKVHSALLRTICEDSAVGYPADVQPSPNRDAKRPEAAAFDQSKRRHMHAEEHRAVSDAMRTRSQRKPTRGSLVLTRD